MSLRTAKAGRVFKPSASLLSGVYADRGCPGLPESTQISPKMAAYTPSVSWIQGLLLSSLVCPLHAGINSGISFDLQTIPPASFFEAVTAEWPQKDSHEIQYDQTTNDGNRQTSGSSFPGKWGRQATGSSGRGFSEVGATSKQVEQAGIVPQKRGLAAHHLSPVASDHEGERNDAPPPAKRIQPDPAAPVICSRCQKTLNEQEVTRALRGSTAELVACDACLHSDKSAPEPKRSKGQSGKRKQDSNPQGGPATDTVEGVEALRQSLGWKMNELECEAAEQLFTCLKNLKEGSILSTR